MLFKINFTTAFIFVLILYVYLWLHDADAALRISEGIMRVFVAAVTIVVRIVSAIMTAIASLCRKLFKLR